MIILSSDFYGKDQLNNNSIAITSNDQIHDEKILLELAKREQCACTKIAKIFDSKNHVLNMKFTFPDKKHKESFIRVIKSCEDLCFITDEHKIKCGIRLSRESLKNVK